MRGLVTTAISAFPQAAFTGCSVTCDTVLNGEKDVHLADLNFVLHDSISSFLSLPCHCTDTAQGVAAGMVAAAAAAHMAGATGETGAMATGRGVTAREAAAAAAATAVTAVVTPGGEAAAALAGAAAAAMRAAVAATPGDDLGCQRSS